MRFPTDPVEIKRWTRVIERNEELDRLKMWSRRWTSLDEPGVMASLQTPAVAENRVYIREVMDALEQMSGPEQAAWFLAECDRSHGDKYTTDVPLSTAERIRMSRMRKRLKEVVEC